MSQWVKMISERAFLCSLDVYPHCNPVQGRTGGVQGSCCFENRFPVLRIGYMNEIKTWIKKYSSRKVSTRTTADSNRKKIYATQRPIKYKSKKFQFHFLSTCVALKISIGNRFAEKIIGAVNNFFVNLSPSEEVSYQAPFPKDISMYSYKKL